MSKKFYNKFKIFLAFILSTNSFIFLFIYLKLKYLSLLLIQQNYYIRRSTRALKISFRLRFVDLFEYLSISKTFKFQFIHIKRYSGLNAFNSVDRNECNFLFLIICKKRIEIYWLHKK